MYILVEMQTNNGQTAVVTPVVYENRLEAESVYHQKLAAAAISSVQIHSVAMLDDHGGTIKRDYYEHIEE